MWVSQEGWAWCSYSQDRYGMGTAFCLLVRGNPEMLLRYSCWLRTRQCWAYNYNDSQLSKAQVARLTQWTETFPQPSFFLQFPHFLQGKSGLYLLALFPHHLTDTLTSWSRLRSTLLHCYRFSSHHYDDNSKMNLANIFTMTPVITAC